MACIIVAGYMVRNPLGGSLWTHLQHVVGLRDLGHDVYFFEDFGWPNSCYDLSRDRVSDDAAYGLAVVGQLMKRFNLDKRWAYRDAKRTYYGLSAKQVDEIISRAELLLNLGGVTWLEGFERIPQRVFVDGDPGFVQIRAASDPQDLQFMSGHTHFFSHGRNIGQPGCPVPTLGLHWRGFHSPVVLREWPVRFDARAKKFTTVMNWRSYEDVKFKGEILGQKSREFLKILPLPSRSTQVLEVTVGDAPLKKLSAHGWHVANPFLVSKSADSYRDYIRNSRGELSVAKNGYVKMRSGIVPDRTANYLASGKPVILQDTGYPDWLPVGAGLLSFTNLEEAAAAIENVNSDYRRHCKAARAIAEEFFDSDKVLRNLLDSL